MIDNHLVIGSGNIGNDILIELKARGENAIMVSRSTGWEYPKNSVEELGLEGVTHVWCAVGAGSVEAAEKNVESFIDLHVRLPARLMQFFKGSIILFSTEYLLCQTPVRSKYSSSKEAMERWWYLNGGDGHFVFNVGSVYGTHKPCFVSRFLEKSDEILITGNWCHPTPSKWISKQAVDLVKSKTYGQKNILPRNSCSNEQIAKAVFSAAEKKITIRNIPPNPMRPVYFVPTYLTTPTWEELWGEHGQTVVTHWKEKLGK